MADQLDDGAALAAELRRLAALDGFRAVPLAAPTRALLRHFAAGDPDRPWPTGDVDWDEVYQGCCRNGLLGLAQRALANRRGEGRGSPPPPAFRRAVARAQGLTGLRLAVLGRAGGSTLRGLLAAGVDPIVLKGPALGQLVYPEAALRPFGDLDLLLRARDVPAAHRALLAQGFEAGQDPAGLAPRLMPQLTPYELQYWHRGRQLLVEIHIDDPFSTGLVARDLDGYWRRAVPITVGGVAARALALDDQVLQLCAHAHYHGYTRLNWLADLAFIVRDHGPALDWDRIAARTRAEALEVPVYYSLHLLGALLDVHAPAGTLAALRPDPFRRYWHARYLPEARMLAWGAETRPFTGFFSAPFLGRLLPDMLVMGRRPEKARALLRLLAPPAAWLRAYYRLAADRPVAPHYLLHPLKLLAHAAADVARALGGPRPGAAPQHPVFAPPWSASRDAGRPGAAVPGDLA